MTPMLFVAFNFCSLKLTLWVFRRFRRFLMIRTLSISLISLYLLTLITVCRCRFDSTTMVIFMASSKGLNFLTLLRPGPIWESLSQTALSVSVLTVCANLHLRFLAIWTIPCCVRSVRLITRLGLNLWFTRLDHKGLIRLTWPEADHTRPIVWRTVKRSTGQTNPATCFFQTPTGLLSFLLFSLFLYWPLSGHY